MAIMLKSSIQAILLDQLDNHESLFLQITYSGHTFIFCGVYRPPSAESHYLRRLQHRMCTFRKTTIILVADFNVPGIDWVNENIGTSENSPPILFFPILCSRITYIKLSLNQQEFMARRVRSLISCSSTGVIQTLLPLYTRAYQTVTS